MAAKFHGVPRKSKHPFSPRTGSCSWGSDDSSPMQTYVSPALASFLSAFSRQTVACGEEDRGRIVGYRGDQVLQIFAQQGLSAGEAHDARAQFADLPYGGEHVLGRHLAPLMMAVAAVGTLAGTAPGKAHVAGKRQTKPLERVPAKTVEGL